MGLVVIMTIKNIIMKILPRRFSYKLSDVNKLLAEITPNYKILSKRLNEKRIIKNLYESRNRYIHDGAGFNNVENNNITEFPNVWIEWNGNYAGGGHATGNPGSTWDDFKARIIEARGQFKQNVVKHNVVDKSLEQILKTIKKAKYNPQTCDVEYNVPAQLQNYFGIINEREVIVDGAVTIQKEFVPFTRRDMIITGIDLYIPKKQEVLLNKVDIAIKAMSTFASRFTDEFAVNGQDISFLITDYTPAAPKKFNMTNDQKAKLKHSLLVNGVGKKMIQKAIGIRTDKSQTIVETMGRCIVGEVGYSTQEKLVAIKARMDDYVVGTAGINDILAMFTQIERDNIRHIHQNVEPDNFISSIAVDYRRNKIDLAALKAVYAGPAPAVIDPIAAGPKTLMQRITSKVHQLAELRQGTEPGPDGGEVAKFNRYPLDTAYPRPGQLTAEALTYLDNAYAGADHAKYATPEAYENAIFGTKQRENLTVGRKEKKHAQRSLMADMFNHYTAINNARGGVQNDTRKKNNVEVMFAIVIDANRIGGVEHYGGNADLEQKAHAFIGLYKLHKTLERM